MVLNIAIADKSEEYIERIASVLGEYDGVNLSTFTEESALEEALVSRNFDVLLFASNVYSGYIKGKKGMLSIMLWDEKSGMDGQFQSYKKIKKFQQISKIYQQVLELYADVCGDIGTVAGQKKTTIVTVCSPVGGVGKTTLALAAATKYAVQGYRCLYINFETVASDECYLPQKGNKGISEIAAQLGEKINFSLKVQGLLQEKRDNLFYLNHFDSPNDMYELTIDEIKELLEVFEQSGYFDIMVIDMEGCTDKKAMTVFEKSDRIILVEKADKIAENKLRIFLGQAHIVNTYGKKMYIIQNFYRGREPEIESNINVVGKIDAVQNPDSAQFIEMLGSSVCMDCFLKILS